MLQSHPLCRGRLHTFDLQYFPPLSRAFTLRAKVRCFLQGIHSEGDPKGQHRGKGRNGGDPLLPRLGCLDVWAYSATSGFLSLAFTHTHTSGMAYSDSSSSLSSASNSDLPFGFLSCTQIQAGAEEGQHCMCSARDEARPRGQDSPRSGHSPRRISPF